MRLSVNSAAISSLSNLDQFSKLSDLVIFNCGDCLIGNLSIYYCNY